MENFSQTVESREAQRQQEKIRTGLERVRALFNDTNVPEVEIRQIGTTEYEPLSDDGMRGGRHYSTTENAVGYKWASHWRRQDRFQDREPFQVWMEIMRLETEDLRSALPQEEEKIPESGKQSAQSGLITMAREAVFRAASFEKEYGDKLEQVKKLKSDLVGWHSNAMIRAKMGEGSEKYRRFYNNHMNPFRSSDACLNMKPPRPWMAEKSLLGFQEKIEKLYGKTLEEWLRECEEFKNRKTPEEIQAEEREAEAREKEALLSAFKEGAGFSQGDGTFQEGPKKSFSCTCGAKNAGISEGTWKEYQSGKAVKVKCPVCEAEGLVQRK